MKKCPCHRRQGHFYVVLVATATTSVIVVVAAAANEDDDEQDDPGATAVTKEIVSAHCVFPPFFRFHHILCKTRKKGYTLQFIMFEIIRKIKKIKEKTSNIKIF